MRRYLVLLAVMALTVGVLAAPAGAGKPEPAAISADFADLLATASGGPIDILIGTESHDYSDAIAAVETAGGTVTRQFKYARGIAATVPAAGLIDLFGAGVGKIGLDQKRTLAAAPEQLAGVDPAALDAALMSPTELDASGYEIIAADAAALVGEIDTYWGYISQNAWPVWDEGNFGQDSLIAVIDTGVYADHVMFSDGMGGSRAIDGVDLSADVGTPFEGWSRVDNHYHGTHVAGIAAGAAAIVAPNDDPLVESIEYHAGISLPVYDSDNKIIPLIGMAPEALLYGIKVFAHDGGGASESTIIAGIEHAIEQKELYDSTGGAEGYDIDVINMSLGGWNGFDGRDLEDQVVNYATAAGITVVSAASNDGPYSGSIQSPGTANSSITAGAIAEPVTTRVFWDIYYGLSWAGDYLFTSDDPQVIYFSSRGPTADGRDKPTASAIGVFVLSAMTGSPGALGWASGTSMATPNIAGLAALLNTYGEPMGASPYDYKQAIVAGAHPVPGFDELDQGAGLIDAAASMSALEADGNLGEAHPDLRNGYSARIAQPKGEPLQNVNAKHGTTFTVSLAPGMQQHYYFQLQPNAERVTIDVTDVDLGIDPILFNSFELYVQGGMSGVNNAYVDTTNVYGNASFVIEDLSTTATGDIFGVNTQDMPLMPGYWKLVIENDWTSFDTITGTFTVNVETGDNSVKPDESYSDKFVTGDETFFPVGFGPGGVELELSWKDNYQRYPTADMDLIVVWFDTNGAGHVEFGGATINSPEKVLIDSTDVAEVYVLVSGYDTYGKTVPWTLDVFYR